MGWIRFFAIYIKNKAYWWTFVFCRNMQSVSSQGLFVSAGPFIAPPI